MDEEAVAKKLEVFLAEMLRFGCVQGFKCMEMKVRGREELTVSIANNSMASTPMQSPSASVHTYKNLPRNESSLMLSARTQRSLSGFGYLDVGLPPASPSADGGDDFTEDPQRTVYLIAGYSMYNCPYAWVRTNHSRLVKLNQDDAKDSPLKLESTSNFASEDIHIWDVVGELIEMNTRPSPENPFAVDFGYFECLSKFESILASGAMIQVLLRILHHRTPTYHKSVLRDVHRLLKQHYADLADLHAMKQATARAHTPISFTPNICYYSPAKDHATKGMPHSSSSNGQQLYFQQSQPTAHEGSPAPAQLVSQTESPHLSTSHKETLTTTASPSSLLQSRATASSRPRKHPTSTSTSPRTVTFNLNPHTHHQHGVPKASSVTRATGTASNHSSCAAKSVGGILPQHAPANQDQQRPQQHGNGRQGGHALPL